MLNGNKISIKQEYLHDIENKKFIDSVKNRNDGVVEFLNIYDNKNIQSYAFKDMNINEFLSLINNKSIDLESIFINSSKPNNTNLVQEYSKIQDLELQNKFLNYLKIIDKDIIKMEPQLKNNQPVLRILLKNSKKSMISSELEEGTNRFIQILATILTSKHKIVLIDEIENGIHHSKLYDIWRAIIEIVQKEDIQLFVTTHDKESIEALNRASEDMNFSDVTSLELYKKDNVIHPIIRQYSSFNTTAASGMDVR